MSSLPVTKNQVNSGPSAPANFLFSIIFYLSLSFFFFFSLKFNTFLCGIPNRFCCCCCVFVVFSFCLQTFLLSLVLETYFYYIQNIKLALNFFHYFYSMIVISGISLSIICLQSVVSFQIVFSLSWVFSSLTVISHVSTYFYFYCLRVIE